MDIMKFGQQSFVGATGMIERIESKEKQMRNYRGLTKNGNWAYGWYAEVEGNSYIINPDAGMAKCECGGHGFAGFIEVIPETVGQSTGLKDKNGKEIYDGDIIAAYAEHDERSESWVVMWWPERAQFVFGNGSLDVEQAAKEDLVIQERDEIIGNIHTTPELMEQDNGK